MEYGYDANEIREQRLAETGRRPPVSGICRESITIHSSPRSVDTFRPEQGES
jgi:hypothetical protein